MVTLSGSSTVVIINVDCVGKRQRNEQCLGQRNISLNKIRLERDVERYHGGLHQDSQ